MNYIAKYLLDAASDTKLGDILGVDLAVIDSNNLFRTHGLGILYRKVAQGSDTHHSNRLVGPSTVLAKSSEGGETGTQQRGS